MKYILIALLSFLSYHCCSGYPVVKGELLEDFLLENATSIEYWFGEHNETPHDSSTQMQGIVKKVINKIKEGINAVKDKVKGGFDIVKNKVKDGFDMVKDKVKDSFDKVKDEMKVFKDKMGSKENSRGGFGAGAVGGYYRDNYDRDKYNKDYYREDNSFNGVSGFFDPNLKWISLWIGTVMLVGILGTIIYFLLQIKRD